MAFRTITRSYQDSDAESATQCLLCAFDEDPLMRAMVGRMHHEWEDIAPVMFSWTNSMLHKSYGMTDVVIDADTGKVLCHAGWELPNMTVMLALRCSPCILCCLSRSQFRL